MSALHVYLGCRIEPTHTSMRGTAWGVQRKTQRGWEITPPERTAPEWAEPIRAATLEAAREMIRAFITVGRYPAPAEGAR